MELRSLAAASSRAAAPTGRSRGWGGRLPSPARSAAPGATGLPGSTRGRRGARVRGVPYGVPIRRGCSLARCHRRCRVSAVTRKGVLVVDLIGWVTSGIAAISAGVAVWQAIEARHARVAARESAESASRAATDSATALTKLSAIAEEEAARVDPPWTVEHVRGDMYRVINGSREICREVDLEPGGSPVRFDGHGAEDIHPSAGKEFFFAASMGTQPHERRVTVTWHLDRHPERLTWVGDIPRRPKR